MLSEIKNKNKMEKNSSKHCILNIHIYSIDPKDYRGRYILSLSHKVESINNFPIK